MTFDGEEGKRDGMARVDAAASEEWKRCADIAIKAATQRCAVLSTDEPKEYMKEHFPNAHTHNDKAWGPRMKEAAKAGMIKRKYDTIKTAENQAHRRDKNVWISKIYRGEGPRFKARKPFEIRNSGWF